MWTGDSTVENTLDCRVPFSFFFDLVQAYWRSPNLDAKLALHRVCTLVRKQQVTFALVECALGRQDVREDIDTLAAEFDGGGTAQAISFAFFRGDLRDANAIADEDFIGVVTLINYKCPNAEDYQYSYVYEAVLAPPHTVAKNGDRVNLLNNFIARDEEFHRLVRGKTFKVRGVYYCQQNSRTHVCAHAGLRMTLNSGYPAHSLLTPSEINRHVQYDWTTGGLQIGDIVDTIKRMTGSEPIVVDCTAVRSVDYLTILSSLAESGCLVLMVFETFNPNVEHVVTVFGYTRNSDEWHPQAIPLYSGATSAQYYPSSAWVDHYLIHDDNLGPYYTLSARVMESIPQAPAQVAQPLPNNRPYEADPKIKPHWIIAANPTTAPLGPIYAQGLAASVLARSLSLPQLRGLGVEGRWFAYMTDKPWRYVLRSLLMSKSSYQAHLARVADHEGNRFSEREIRLTDSLPDWFWMVEFSLPALFTGNRSKLGEMFVSCVDDGKGVANVLGVRFPGLLLMALPNAMQSANKLGVTAHVPYYVAKHHGNEW